MLKFCSPSFFILIFSFIGSNIIFAQTDSLDHTNEVVIDTIQQPDFDSSTTIFQKISQDNYFEVVLKTNFDSLIKNRKVSSEKYPGTILFKNPNGEQLKLNVKIEPRGRSRRKVCALPPLKIDFSKKELKKFGLFPGCDKLKLVTNCNDSENSEQFLMKEYWTYQLYNRVTPESFKVFTVKITYVNSNNLEDRMVRYGFFIESNDELALRLKGDLIDMFGTKPEALNAQSYHNTLMFQYMIGNLDWDIKVNRNVKFIKPDAGGKLILVPYDFDFSALVRAPYARLNPEYNQKFIEERFPQGKFTDKDALLNTAKKFNTLRKDEFNCYRNCQVLSKKVKRKMSGYLDTFYSVLKDKGLLTDLFLME